MKRAYKTEILLSEKQRKKIHQTIVSVDMSTIYTFRQPNNITKRQENTCQVMTSLNGSITFTPKKRIHGLKRFPAKQYSNPL